MATTVPAEIYELSEVIIPLKAQLDSIVGSYENIPNAIRCGFFSCRTNHKKGFIVSFIDPNTLNTQKSTIGHICGKREFTDWEIELTKYNNKIREKIIKEKMPKYYIKLKY